ncbi:UDP-N-acetylmuramate dehydrogenase [Pantoea sp. Aalb]|uniref:UDP-N-acetylmuramate dehydrogenase n=1 Tax=Pantoea sp. Aalb TaxID=2576762 RepID=UPI001320C6C0|nr:UDP-N-acetylmuramate dehydrogenase [Pantoea sp. Aalb]
MTISLKKFHTFGIEVNAQKIIIANTLDAIITSWEISQRANYPFIVLGEGSNVLFLETFSGCVVINAVKGIFFDEDKDAWYIHVGAGENWHALVELTLKKGIPGLENLALIPGLVGSAAIQNIGAYGVNFKDFCYYIDVINLFTQQKIRLSCDECQFGYRDSIFKHIQKNKYVIIAVCLRLTKHWKPVLKYSELINLNPSTVCAKDIFKTVCHIRQSKLPDPSVIGNVGSFFKNPFIKDKHIITLLNRWPNVPYYPQANGDIKIAAGWLIDQCNLKGHRVGGAAVYHKQALVLINEHHATPNDIVSLAHQVRNKVGEKFNIWLEPEVHFINAYGECNAVEVIS